MAWYPIGPSSYPDLFGQTQYVNAKRIADQFLSMKRDFDAMKIAAGSGDRLSPNEARRTRARQSALYQNYLRYGYPKAAVPFTSRHDEFTHGNAIDVGVTMANGQNRALTSAEFDWMHANAERRGFTWTGRYFNEPWHIEGATRVEVVPPYPDIIAGADPTPQPEGPKPKPEPTVLNGEDVARLITVSGGKAPLTNTIALVDGLRAVVRTTSATQAYRLGRVNGDLLPGQNTDEKIRARLAELHQNVDAAEFAEYLRAVDAAGGKIDGAYKGAY